MSVITKILFIGSKHLGLSILKEMYLYSPKTIVGILTIDDSDDVRSEFNCYKKFSKEKGVELFVAKSRVESENIIDACKPDMCFVSGWYWLFSERLVTSVPSGFIGVHNSALPKYRGGSPLVWAMICGESEVSASIFSFTPGMDDGPIWGEVTVGVDVNDYISDVLNRLETQTIQLFQKIYPRIINSTLTPVPQCHSHATYCAQRTVDDGKIKWERGANEVYNFIRSQSYPYPGAFTNFNSQRLIIWQARPFKFKYYGTSGQVAKISDDEVYVICGGSSAIILEEVELGGIRDKAGSVITSIRARFVNE